MLHDIGRIAGCAHGDAATKCHEDEGVKFLKELSFLSEHNELLKLAIDGAGNHNEKWDGTGYLGMKGEKIHLISRIAAVADVFDALVSKRSYKKAWTTDQAREIIMSESGTHFDPNVVQAFLDHFDEIVEVFHSFPEME